MIEKEELTEIEIVERYLLLLLGVADKPIPSHEHLQKELFILSKAHPKIAEFINFEKHYKGPYSKDINDLANNPVYYVGAYQCNRKGKIWIAPEGKKIYDNLVKEYSEDPKFNKLLAMMKMVRELYDKLSRDELLSLIYVTYPEYKQMSRISNELLSPRKRKEIARRLLRKEAITEKRYLELLDGKV